MFFFQAFYFLRTPRILLFPLLGVLFVPSALGMELQSRVIADGLDRPWSLAVLPDQRFLITEKTGQLRIADSAGKISEPIAGLPDIAVVGQGGLLDVVLHPNFSENRWLYLSYVEGNSVRGYSTEVVRAELEGLTLKNLKRIFVALPKTKGGRHFGSRLAIASKNNPSKQLLSQGQQYQLFISLGDRGVRSQAQDLSNHHGSLIRLNDDGSIPKDNPFINVPNAKPEIYSYGHRNIQGLAINTLTGELWAHEHGPQGGDELNVIAKGKNYGWPTITYGVNYGFGTTIGEGTEREGMEQPEYYWNPSIAPSGFAFYHRNDQTLWLIGALKYQLLAILTRDNNRWNEQRLLEGEHGRIRDVRVVNDRIFILTDASAGKLIELTLKP